MASRRWLSPWPIATLLVIVLSGLVYVGALGGDFVWDDRWLVSGDGIGGGDSLAHCFTVPFLAHYFRPLVSVSFFFQRPLFGYDPAGYHMVNLLLHVATTGMLICMLLEAFGRQRIALLGGLLFALQPVQVGAVAWIGGHTDALCAFWMVLFMWALIRAAHTTGDTRSFCLAGAVAAYTLALFTKEQMLAALPLVPLAFRCFPPRRGVNMPRTEWWAALPFVVATVVFLAMGYFLGLPRHGGVRPDLPGLLALVGRTLCYYTLALLAPTPRWMHSLSLGILERAGFWPVVAGWAALALCVLLFLRWRRSHPGAAWFMAFTVLTLLPVSNVMPLPFLLIAPYRAGVSGLGVAALLGWALGRWSAAARAWGPRRTAVAPLRSILPSVWPAVLMCLVFWWGGLTVWGAIQWRKEVPLFQTIVRYDPDNIPARYVLAWNMLAQRHDAQAIPQLEAILRLLFRSASWQSGESAVRAVTVDHGVYQRTLQNQGSRDDPRRWLSALYAMLGKARMRTGQSEAARTAYLAGERFWPDDPDINTGLCYFALVEKEYSQVLRRAQAVLQAGPDRADVHEYAGRAFAAQNDWPSAYAEFEKWARLDPDSTQARHAQEVARLYLSGAVQR